MKIFPLNLVKTYINDHNELIEQKKLADLLVDSINQTSELVPLDTKPLKNDLLNHIQNFKDALKDIENLNEDLLDGRSYEMLYKANLTRLMADKRSVSLEYYSSILDETGAFKLPHDYVIYIENMESFDLLSNSLIKTAQKIHSLMESDYCVLLKSVTYNKADLNAFTAFITDNTQSSIQCLKHGKLFVKNIENLPEYNKAVDRMSMFLEQFNLSDLYVLHTAVSDSSNFLINQAMLHPHLVSVLGNALFLKLLLPLVSRYYNMSNQQNFWACNQYNHPSNWEKFMKKSLLKTAYKKSYNITVEQIRKKQWL